MLECLGLQPRHARAVVGGALARLHRAVGDAAIEVLSRHTLLLTRVARAQHRRALARRSDVSVATAATAAVTTARTTTTAAGAGTILRLIDLQWASAHVDAIEILDGTRGIGLAHLNEAKAARTASVPIDRERHRLDGAVRSKQGTDLRICRGKGKVPNVNFSH